MPNRWDRKLTAHFHWHRFSVTIKTVSSTYTDPAGRIRAWTYDQANRPLGLDPGNGSQVSIGSYEWNRPGTFTLPGVATLNYVYNKIQQVASITPKDPGGNLVLDYDYTCNASRNVAAKSTEHGNYSYNYDQHYRLIMAGKPGGEESYAYDPLGREIGEEVHDPTDAQTRFANFEYNTSGRLEKIMHPGDAEESLDYDSINNLIPQINATGMRTDMTYDALSRLLTVTEAGHATARYT